MQLHFLHPAWLLGALALVPLLAHLFSRTRPRRRLFPSVLLLREALRHVTRVRQPRDRWLLLLRTLAMLALALALLQPWLFSRFGGAGSVRTVVLVVDVTASMGYVDGTRTRLASAATAAEDILASLPTNSRANIVWAQAHPAAVLPEPAPNLDFLRQALRSATVRPEAGSPAEALSLALRQLTEGAGERELVVISDFQKTAWAPVRWEAPGGVRVTRVAVGEGDGGNLALSGLFTEPERPVAGQEARLVCRVRNFSAEPRRATVFAQAGESRLSQPVELAPWGETLAVLPVKFPAEGPVPLKASLTGDSFPADDVRYAIAEVRGALEVCIAAPAGDATGESWLRAARALDQVVVRRVEPAAAGADRRADVLLVAHWEGQGREGLRAQRERGAAVVIQPASAREATGRLDELPAGAPPAAPLQQREPPGWRTRPVSEEHPLFALFARGAYGDPADGRFQRRVAMPANGGTPVLAFDDGMAALTLFEPGAESPQAGPLALWNLDLGASDWPARPGYLTFFGELLQYLARRGGHAVSAGIDSGEPLRFDAGAAADPKDLTLLGEDDKALPLQRAGAQLSTVEPPPPGTYRWMAQGAVLARAVVNFPEIESDLRRLGPGELSGGSGTLLAGGSRERLTALREGWMLWPWCLAAAAACLLGEGLLLTRFAGREATA